MESKNLRQSLWVYHKNRTCKEVEVDGRGGPLARAEVGDGGVAADAPRGRIVRQRRLLRRVKCAQPQPRPLRPATPPSIPITPNPNNKGDRREHHTFAP